MVDRKHLSTRPVLRGATDDDKIHGLLLADHRSRGVQVVDHYLVVVVKFQCRVKAVEVTALNRTAFCCSRAKRFSLRMYSASADGTVSIASAMR